jgi:hypothetical protein
MSKVFAPVAAIVLVGFTGISAASAQERVHVGLSGRPIVLGAAIQCDPRYGPPSPSGTALHGRVITRPIIINRCGNPRHPAAALIYVSYPGFRGTDQAFLYLGGPPQTRKIVVQ